MMRFLIVLLFNFFVFSEQRQPIKYTVKSQSVKFDNPNFVRDRYKFDLNKPAMPSNWTDRFKLPYHPAWMDYCDPYHCNDYHKVACGLNRRQMRFKWFQSTCHIILNNKCASYRGTLKYDVVDPKFCYIYVMYLRQGCREACSSDDEPVCAVSQLDNGVTIFADRCAMMETNCRSGAVHEYEEAEFGLCSHYID